MTAHSMTTSENEHWEDTLREWAQHFPTDKLGMMLTTLLREITPATTRPVLEAIAQQYRQPDDQRRWEIFGLAEKTGFSTPVGALALSQFWSMGSMSPDGLPPVYPDPQLSPRMLHCVLIMLTTELAENPVDGIRQLISRCARLEAV